MLIDFITRLQRKPVPMVTLLLFCGLVTGMGWLRFGPLFDSPVNIGYGLPLLVCLWYPERRLLWGLMVVFAFMSAYKVFVMMPAVFAAAPFPNWALQMINMLVIGLTVQVVMELIAKLRAQKAQLEESNQELLAREEEITRQNEELAQQNEEIQQQAEEVQQQAEELQSQSEEFQLTNLELAKRQAVLQVLLESLKTDGSRDLPDHICHLLISLLGEEASAAVVLEKDGGDLVVLAHAGPVGLSTRRWAFARSFAAMVMGSDRTACIADLRLRPDLEGAQTNDSAFRSVIATPLRHAGNTVGVIKVYSARPHNWTKEQFTLIEWISAQCSLLMDSRRLQTELQRTNTDLDRLVTMRTAELEELVNELEHFSYTITHDLRAPLRAMTGFAGLLADECTDMMGSNSREYLNRIITASSRMDRLITDALSYSQIVRHEMPLQPIDAARLITGMIESYPLFQEPKARIEIAADLPLILGNEAGLTQCFSNLLGNAVKFVAPGTRPHVRIGGERRGDRVCLWCEDNGIGIPADLQSRVFIMFQRLSKDYEGTGIGLALVKKVVERMGGTVGVESEPGRGSRFWVELRSPDSAS
jgi:signal transduction histidine kinase